MSGNPFRRPNKVIGDHPSVGSDIFERLKPPQQTKTKRVVIQSSPDSPEDSYPHALRFDHGGRRLSASSGRSLSPPPPPINQEDEEDGSDSSASADDDIAQATVNTRRNSAGSPMFQSTPASSGVKAPYNPFARTLATNEAALGGQADRDTEKNAPTSRQGHDGGRPVLDVDAFKNILMTGSAVPSTSAGQRHISSPAPARFPGTGGNTDTSPSFSRQSLFDQSYNIHPESPRSSFEGYHSSSDVEDFENEGSSLMGPLDSRPQEIAPRAPPKPKAKGPQTVSFAEFDQSIPPDFHAGPRATPPVNARVQGILRPSISRSHSDLNKPLPPPPQVSIESAPPPLVPEKDAPAAPGITEPDNAGSADSDAKKAPPPPPASRRQGPGASRGPAPSDIIPDPRERTPEPAETEHQENDLSAKSAPPPPPSRRAHPSSATSTAQQSEARTDPSAPQVSSSAKTMPPPPPRRHPSKSGSHMSTTRSSSPSSIRSDTLRAQPSAAAPPAPPPRRTGGSKRNSGDFFRRGSTHSFDSDKPASISSLRRVEEPGETETAVVSPGDDPKRDILADMTAFQAEIDALMAKQDGAKGPG